MTTDTGLIERAEKIKSAILEAEGIDVSQQQEEGGAVTLVDINERGLQAIRALLTELSRAPAGAEGWVLVPKDPTPEMLRASTMEVPTWDDDASRRKYKAMIAASPAQETKTERRIHPNDPYIRRADIPGLPLAGSAEEAAWDSSRATPPAEARELVESQREVLPLVYGIVHEAWHALDDSEEWSPTEFLITAEHYEELSNLFDKLKDLLDGTDDTTLGWEKPLSDMLRQLAALATREEPNV